MRTGSRFQRVRERLPPSSGAAVMGTGIVSVALHLDGRDTASAVLLWIAAATWVLLAVAWRPPPGSAGTLTAVAGSCVLATRLALAGDHRLAAVLLAVAVAAWPVLTLAVLREWRPPARGAHFLLAVAAEGVAVALGVLASDAHDRRLATVALVPFVAGLVLYAVVAAGFAMDELARGRGDQWVAGGALAISALAAGDLGAARVLPAVMDEVAAVLWVLAMLWLPALVLAELRHPRLRYHAERWATVFPVGMYAAMSFAVGGLLHARWMVDFARGWTWVALAVWAVVLAGTVRRATAARAA